MVRIIFIRHGEKEFSNGKGKEESYQHDPPIINPSKILEKGEYLKTIFGKPTYCITSPYLRCRETLFLLLHLNLSKIEYNIYVDNNISEYLGNQKVYYVNGKKTTTPLVSPGTLKFNPPPVKEHFKDLLIRSELSLDILFKEIDLLLEEKKCNNFGKSYNKISSNELKTYKKDIVIWVVTHGLLISLIYKILLEKYNFSEDNSESWQKEPGNLQGIVLEKEEGYFFKI